MQAAMLSQSTNATNWLNLPDHSIFFRKSYIRKGKCQRILVGLTIHGAQAYSAVIAYNAYKITDRGWWDSKPFQCWPMFITFISIDSINEPLRALSMYCNDCWHWIEVTWQSWLLTTHGVCLRVATTWQILEAWKIASSQLMEFVVVECWLVVQQLEVQVAYVRERDLCTLTKLWASQHQCCIVIDYKNN